MRPSRATPAILLAVLLPLIGCAQRACTLAAARSVVFVDVSALEIVEPEGVELCLDDRCRPISDTLILENPGDDVWIDVVGDESRRTLAIRTVGGLTLAGPQIVEIPSVYPNGEGCPGAGLQGRYQVASDGVFTPVESR